MIKCKVILEHTSDENHSDSRQIVRTSYYRLKIILLIRLISMTDIPNYMICVIIYVVVGTKCCGGLQSHVIGFLTP